MYAEAFHEKKVNVSSSKKNLKWFCDELALMRETLHFLNSACKMNTTPENINTRNKFRKQYRTAITQAKIKTNDNFIKESPNKSKAIWKIIAFNTKQKDYSNEIILNADELIQHFVKIAFIIIKQLPISNDDTLKYQKSREQKYNNTFSFQQVSYNQVRDVVNSLNNSSSSVLSC
nr:unnamed protein product [Callosobruchus analis]